MTTDLWHAERRLWLDGADAYEALMAPDCVMAFPGIGLLDGDAIIEGLRQAPRWSAVEMDAGRAVAREDTVVLAYAATGRREGAASYCAACLSTWHRGAEGWRILAHQQTPL